MPIRLAITRVPRAIARSGLALLVLSLTAPAAAQTREPIPKFAIDLHAAMVGLPTGEGWVPVVSDDTEVPGRGWGLAGGGTVYPFRLGNVTLGFGAILSTGGGEGQSLTITTGSGSTATTRVTPVVRTSVFSLAPHVSINFGHKLGWSYLSAGLGTTKVKSSADAVGTTPEVIIPEAWNQALNFGGGARWFMKEHLGASFDVRFIKLGAREGTATLSSAQSTLTWSISAGISIQ